MIKPLADDVEDFLLGTPTLQEQLGWIAALKLPEPKYPESDFVSPKPRDDFDTNLYGTLYGMPAQQYRQLGLAQQQAIQAAHLASLKQGAIRGAVGAAGSLFPV
jgi:hypothetical protein